MKKLYLVLTTIIFSFLQTFSQVTTTINPTITQLQQKLQGSGITITGLTMTCKDSAFALYSGGTGVLSTLPNGILLTTGTATNVAGPSASNFNSVSNNMPGSALGDNLANDPGGTSDGCYMTFTLTPSCSTLSINYVFASEEYPDFVGSFNDAFGFVLTGPNPTGPAYNETNIALVPGTSIPVTINNVNNGWGNLGPCTNCAYYNANPSGIAYDGATDVLTASVQVTPCQSYVMTIGVWDDFDDAYDTGVFLDVNGLSCAGSPTLTAIASPSNICAPQTITLTASGGIASGSYTWSAPASGGLVTTIGQTVTANPTGATVYTLSYSDINTCPGFPLQEFATLSYNPPPSFSASQSPAGNICAGQSATLTANGGAGTYSWVPSTGLSTTSNSVTVASPTVTTTYTVTRSVGSCSSFTTITVTVSTPTAITITPATSTICAGGSSTLSTNGTGPYAWTASSGTNPPATATVVVSPASSTTYTVVSGSGSCTVQAVASVSVVPSLTITITPSSTTICNGGTTALTASGASNYTWTPFYGLNAYTGPNVVGNPTVTTTYTIVGVSGACSASTTAIINVTTVNTTVTASATNYCTGTTPITLSASGATSYSWSPGTGLSATTGATVAASPSTTVTYTVVGSTGSCTSTKTITINGVATPTVSVTPASTLICSGQTSSLTASGATNYSWTPLSGLNAYTGANVIASPASTTTYTILGVNGACTNTTTATVSVTVVSPTVTSSSSSYCTGGAPVTMTATGASSYAWSPSAGLSATTGSVVSATPTITTTYSVTGTIGTCSTTKTITINVATTPTISVTSPSTLICAGASGTTLTANGANTYTWDPGLTNGNTLAANPATTTTYTVYGQTSGGCVAVPGTITVSVTSVPVPTLSSSNTTVCVNSTVSISANPSSGYTYNWQPASAIQGAINGSSIIAKPTSTPNITYTLTVSNAVCTKSATTSLQVFSCIPPVANFSTMTNDSICTNGCVTFTNTTIGDAPIAYQWLFPGGTPPTSTQTNPEVCYFAPGNYSVALIATNAFGSDTIIKNNYINVADTPDVRAFLDTTIRIGQTVQLSVSGAGSYQWFPATGLSCSTCTNPIASPTVTTMYIVTGANSPYCKSRDTVTIIVDVICGDFFVPTAFSPNNDGLNETVNVHGYCVSSYNLQIYNRWGEKVFETTSKDNSWDGTYKGKPCDTGVFVYKADGISIDGKAFSLKGNITLIR